MKQDLFLEKNIAPMLLTSSTPFESEDFIYEVKFDGFRCIAYLDDNSTTLKSRNNNDLNFAFPELLQLHTRAKAQCIIDGEIVVLNKNVSDFNSIQRRFAKKDEFKISLAASSTPATFIVFDILYMGEGLFNYKLLERKEILQDTIKPCNNLLISSAWHSGIELFEMAKRWRLEGIVAKRKKSIYMPDTRSKDWLKIKTMPHHEYRGL